MTRHARLVELLTLLGRGESGAEIARITGMSKATLRRAVADLRRDLGMRITLRWLEASTVKEWGIVDPRRLPGWRKWQHWTAEERALLAHLRDQGLSNDEIANAMGVSKRRVSAALIAFGLTRHKRDKATVAQVVQQILKLHDAGKSAREIAGHVGRTVHAVRFHLKKHRPRNDHTTRRSQPARNRSCVGSPSARSR